MAISLKSWVSLFFLLLAGFNYFTLAQEPDDTETFWKGNQRLIALEDIYPLKKKRGARWMRGWGCGWTPYGLCFSPDWRMDIHDNFILPFKDLVMYAYCDQPADTEVFGMGSVVLTKFSKKPDRMLEGRVYRYDKSYNWRRRKHTTYRIFVRTEYYELGVKDQIEESFHPNEVRLKGGYNACRYFKTECRSNEICVPRRLSGRIWPAEYKCVCKEKGWQTIRGRGCVDVDECEKSPCGALFVCINTMGSYKCECLPGYKGSKCDVEINECEENPCPKNSVCKNVPGSFQCTCLQGFTGKDCSETEGSENDVKTTQPTIREHTNKRIAIPRKRPVKIIRKPVFSYDPRHKERAAMIAVMVVFNVLGMFLYWSQKRRRAKKLKKEQETRPSSDQELENEEIILGDKLLENAEETILNSQELNQELKINSEGTLRNEEMEDNELIPNNQGSRPSSNHELENEETILGDQLLENTEESILNSKDLNQELKINSEGTPGSEEMEDNELIPNNQGSRPSSNHELENEETILGDQLLENTEESILNSAELNQELKINSEGTPGSEEMEDNELIPNNQETRPSSKQELENEETILGDQLSENAEETILNSAELNQELKINCEGTPGSEEMEDNELILNKQELQSSETIPSNQELVESTDISSTNQNLKLSETVVSSQEWENTEDIQSIKVLEYSETIPSSQELQDNGTVPRNQVMLENTQTIPSRSQDLENNEVIPTNQEFVNTEAILVNDVWENMEALSSNQILVPNTETVHIPELQAFEEEEIANDRELLADKSDK